MRIINRIFFFIFIGLFLLLSILATGLLIPQDRLEDFMDISLLKLSLLIAGILLLVTINFAYRKSQSLKKEIICRQKIEQDAAIKSDNLEKALALSKATLEATADGILVVGEDRKIAGYNEKFKQMWHIPDSILLERNDNEGVKYVLDQVKDPVEFINNLDRFFNREPDTNVIGLIEFKDGRLFERYTMPQKLGDKIIGRVFSFRDVTERKRMEEQLIFQATHDALTSLPNRTLLLDRINQGIAYARRAGQMAAVSFLDLDRFKMVNDSLGHDMGDVLLQAAATRLKECLRESDTIARWGGDEFILLLSPLNSPEEVEPIIEKALARLEEPFNIKGYELVVTGSVGVSFYPQDGDDANVLLKNADAAMYYAKAEGRNNYKLYQSQMNARTQDLLSLEADLHRALDQDQFTLNYQPLVDLKTGAVIGAEALLRWHHPERGPVSPADFMPIAEETGMIIPIGEWVIRAACAQNKAWQEKGLPPIFVAVNLSGHQFRCKDLAEKIHTILQETQLAPHYLEIELTESTMMESTHIFLNAMDALKKVGVRLAIDDFGTGYSSLSYLKRFPVDKLKIDQSFVRDIAEDQEDAAIVRAIIAMAKQLNLRVVAEGIETEPQVAFLQQHGCDIGQGYLFSKPIDGDACEQLLKTRYPLKHKTASKKNRTQEAAEDDPLTTP